MLNQGSRVLIVDQSEENRQVLRTALERRGMQILEARGPETGLEMARQHRPDLIVVDLECQVADDESIREQFDQQASQEETSLVFLGNARRRRVDAPSGDYVAKPYHYGALIHRIESLLQRRQ